MISRRSWLSAAPLALAGCGRQEQYFGNATPPSGQTLIYEIGAEPGGLDPATALGGSESYVWPALFEGPVSADPVTLEPRAGLATHYEFDASLTELTFYLRGHRNPRGKRLPGGTISAGARWSDGWPVTADDFVFAWRRVVDPALGAENGASLYSVANGRDISEGKARPETLGISAADELTVRVTLQAPAAHFLRVATTQALAAAPRHTIQAFGSSWTTPRRMASSGPFFLHEWKPYERIVLRRNPQYYDAARVRLQEIVFLPVTDGATSVNLYRTGGAYAMHGRAVPPLWIPALRGRRDFHSTPAYRNMFYAFNTTRPPFDNVLVRYAFQMATDKHEIIRFLDAKQTAARTLIPPFGGYTGVETLPVQAGGRTWDVLSHDVKATRGLMRLAGAERLEFDLTYPARTRSKEMAEIIQRQWLTNLGAHVILVTMDWNVWGQTIHSGKYRGVIEGGFNGDYADPGGFLDGFNGRDDGSGWVDPEFRRLADRANAESEPSARMQKVAQCEAHLLRAMPLLPLFFDTNSYLQKPYVAGMTPNVLDIPEFREIWIDTGWRPS